MARKSASDSSSVHVGLVAGARRARALAVLDVEHPRASGLGQLELEDRLRPSPTRSGFCSTWSPIADEHVCALVASPPRRRRAVPPPPAPPPRRRRAACIASITALGSIFFRNVELLRRHHVAADLELAAEVELLRVGLAGAHRRGSRRRRARACSRPCSPRRGLHAPLPFFTSTVHALSGPGQLELEDGLRPCSRAPGSSRRTSPMPAKMSALVGIARRRRAAAGGRGRRRRRRLGLRLRDLRVELDRGVAR